MNVPSYADLIDALQEFHQAWHAWPWSLDRLQAADNRAADLVTQWAQCRTRQPARQLTEPTDRPLHPDGDTRPPHHATSRGRPPKAEVIA